MSKKKTVPQPTPTDVRSSTDAPTEESSQVVGKSSRLLQRTRLAARNDKSRTMVWIHPSRVRRYPGGDVDINAIDMTLGREAAGAWAGF